MGFYEQVREKIFRLAMECGFIEQQTQPRKLESALNWEFFTHLKNGNVAISDVPLYTIKSIESDKIEFDVSDRTLGSIVYRANEIQNEYKTTAAAEGIPWDAPIIEEGYYVGYEYGDFNALRADFAYEDSNTITLIESKLGASETWPTPKDNYKSAQFARYSDWMIAAKHNSEKTNRNLAILSAKDFFTKRWHGCELHKALEFNNRKDKINGFLIMWEDVFRSFMKK